MLAIDIMTTAVISVYPHTLIDPVVQLLASNHISAVPVIDAQKGVVGIISDSDLMHRIAGWPAPHESLIKILVEKGSTFAKRLGKVFGQAARDVMTTPVVTVGPFTPVAEIAEVLADRRIRQVPIVSEGKLVRIVSWANLVEALASKGSAISNPSDHDRETRAKVLEGFQISRFANPIVCDGVVHLWGAVDSAEEVEAHRLIAAAVTGVEAVKNHIIVRKAPPRGIAALV